MRHNCPTSAGFPLQGSCCTCIMVAISGTIVAVLAVTDPLKPEARGVVAALARRGLAVHLVTGDNWRTARAIAEQLAIVNVCAECLPGAKADKIKVCSLQMPFHNAPVLSLAVGHAVSTGHCVNWMTQAGPCMPPHLA
jgi:cation transport ATPase